MFDQNNRVGTIQRSDAMHQVVNNFPNFSAQNATMLNEKVTTVKCDI
jgi:hypothetical protein